MPDFQAAEKIARVAEVQYPRKEFRETCDRTDAAFLDAYVAPVPV